MKKLIGCLCAVLALSACTTLNKNTVSYQASKYDSAKYYVVSGDGKTKDAASKDALENMRAALVQNAPDLAQDKILTDLVANAKVEKVWKDKSIKQSHYLALAVLSRENAHKILSQEMDKIDAQLSGLDAQFANPAEPLADLRIAYRMQPLIQHRTLLDDTYQFLSKTHQSYNADQFFPYKNKLKEKMAAVLVGVDVQGRESKVMITYVVDALNKMGLGVVDISDPEKVLSVEILTDVDNYDSKKVDGLLWASSNAAISLVDATRGVTFSRFNVYERAGTSRAEESMRRSMEAAGKQAAAQITARLEAYLKTK
ncbi:hypothetical protein [Candidatus Avelusimicrobium luingense]|uniref:hypothetical protein n=1 Tax=Candidatus Avelusimicrobium luingense TaxID=3416211 RepID=UPI003D0AFA4C